MKLLATLVMFKKPCAEFVRNMRERRAKEIRFLPPPFFAERGGEGAREGGSGSADNG